MAHARTMMSDVTFAEDAYSCAQGADALVIVTEWNAFRALDLNRIRETMQAAVLVDLRNIYDPKTAAQHGFAYHGVGRSTADASSGAG
jgi:UDPglucose 6-dehydrogenase